MSRPPIAAASRNMSACRRQAVSQVGCRLMVASKAKISRPRCPASVAGARLFTLVRKASISERVDCGAGARAPSAGAGVLLLRSLDITADHVRERLFALKVDISEWRRNGLDDRGRTTDDGTEGADPSSVLR